MDILFIKIARFAQVKDMYWQACLLVLIVAVFNPSTIGHVVWESIPSLRILMEVLIAGDKAFQSSRLDLPSCTFLVLGQLKAWGFNDIHDSSSWKTLT